MDTNELREVANECHPDFEAYTLTHAAADEIDRLKAVEKAARNLAAYFPSNSSADVRIPAIPCIQLKNALDGLGSRSRSRT